MEVQIRTRTLHTGELHAIREVANSTLASLRQHNQWIASGGQRDSGITGALLPIYALADLLAPLGMIEPFDGGDDNPVPDELACFPPEWVTAALRLGAATVALWTAAIGEPPRVLRGKAVRPNGTFRLPAHLVAEQLELAVASIPTGEDDTKSDTPRKRRKKRRELNIHAVDCIRRFKAARKDDATIAMKQVVMEYAEDIAGVSVTGIMRRLNDNPEQWRDDTKAT